MNKYQEYYHLIEDNKNFIDSHIEALNNKKYPIDLRIEYAHELSICLIGGSAGYYVNNKLETFFTDIAKSVDIDNYNIQYKPKTTLHVISEGYKTGGHTRVLERWIKFAPNDEKHSVCITWKRSIVTEKLKKNVEEKNGEIIKLEEENIIKNALKLRELAMSYEYIVLHTHMEDPTALIAFGTEKFTRPVILFNHADHLFWLGKSITDVVFDFRTKTSTSLKYRGIKNTLKCPIPIEFSESYKNKNGARNSLNIPLNQKMLLTVGNPFKYTSVLEDSIFPNLDEILKKDEEINLYAIGPKEESDWIKLKNKYKNRVHLLGIVNFEEGYLDYISSADLVLDSYPMGGGTVLIDAMQAHVPFVSIKITTGQTDFVENSLGFVKKKENAVEKILKCFNDENYKNEILKNELYLFEKDHSEENWKNNLAKIMSKVPKTHTVKDLSKEPEINIIDDLSVMIKLLIKHSWKCLELTKDGILYQKKGIKFLFEKLYYKKNGKTYKVMKILGITVLKKEKK